MAGRPPLPSECVLSSLASPQNVIFETSIHSNASKLCPYRRSHQHAHTRTAKREFPQRKMRIRACCKFAQWPVPKELHEHTIPDDKLINYIGSNFSCTGGDKSGCLCITKDESQYLSQRGGNSLNNTCNL